MWPPALALLALLVIQCLHFAWITGQTTDESYYNGVGASAVLIGDYQFYSEHPPLIARLGFLPIRLMGLRFKAEDRVTLDDGRTPDQSRTGAKLLYQSGWDPQLLLFAQRSPVVLLTLLTAAVIYLWAYDLHGRGGALLSLLLTTLCPNILAHGSLFTTDMGVCCFTVLTFYSLHRYAATATIKYLFASGVCLGLACLSKMSGLLLLPITLMIFVFTPLPASDALAPGWKYSRVFIGFVIFMLYSVFSHRITAAFFAPLALILLNPWLFMNKLTSMKFRILRTAFVLGVWITPLIMIGNYRKFTPLLKVELAGWILLLFMLQRISLSRKFSSRLQPALKAFSCLGITAAAVIMAGYGDFIEMFFRWKPYGHFVNSFQIAFTHSRGYHWMCEGGSFVPCDWRYFLALMVIKTPAASLLFFLIGTAAMIFQNHFKTDRIRVLAAPFAFLLIASFLNRINIGLRHILPVYPFLYLAAGAAIPLIRRIPHRVMKISSASALSLILLISVYYRTRQAPYFLSYFNEFVGSVENGAKITLDSNINWGQDNRHLALLVKKLGAGEIRMAVLANNGAEYDYYGLKRTGIESGDYENPRPGLYALDIHTYLKEQQNARSWFRGKRPDHIAGSTIYIFRAPN